MGDRCIIRAGTSEKMRRSAGFLAQSLYREPITITLIGELGVGKTTFAQGFAAGLGQKERVVSPSFALEQQYGKRLVHIDLYRLKETQARDMLHHSEDFRGIRLIEWANRAKGADLHEDIRITITELPEERGTRLIAIEFRDVAFPSLKEIQTWRREVMLPGHIVRHNDVVAEVCEKLTDNLWKCGVVVRRNALIAAARTHDLLRFVDFRTQDLDATREQNALWEDLRKHYPKDHEGAACQFLSERGYPEIGEIVRTHRGHSEDGAKQPKTTEQLVLSYADKRVLLDKIVTQSERFEYFAQRYAGGKTTPFAKAWYAKVRATEKSLFPDGPPPL